ncbi:hypothetical protein JXA32_00365 [Candidatus Sumerlaeota bacterium]|nr:hypothetical protein [Candidatus Sumerlaeota bacterium]
MSSDEMNSESPSPAPPPEPVMAQPAEDWQKQFVTTLPKEARSDAAASSKKIDAAGRSVDEDKGRVFPCDQCGADLVFHIGVQCLKCPFCGFEKSIEIAEDAQIVERDLQAMLDKIAENRKERVDWDAPEESEVKEVRCSSCGANVEFAGTITSTHCPYCATPIQKEQIKSKEKNRIPADAVLPFFIEDKEARVRIDHWIKSLWFAPNDFVKSEVGGRLTGVYMPYWTYDSMTFTRYTGQRGEHYWVAVGSGKNRRRERRTRWYPASGSFQRFFDDVLIIASEGLPEKVVRNLEPWPLIKSLPFNQQVLAGHLARTYDVELATGFVRAKERMDDALYQDVRERIGGDEQRVHSVDTRYDACTYKHLLLPVYLYPHRFKAKVYQIIVNAGTGEVQGERPWSVWKIAFAVLGVLLVLLAIGAGIGFENIAQAIFGSDLSLIY